jgi:hypothetical protein
MAQSISGEMAWKTLSHSKFTRWEANIDRFSHAPIEIDHVPKFRLSDDDSFFCIGSCFARNIEEHLIYRSRHVLSKRIFAPRAEAPARPNGFVNKFTTMSMVNEVKWALDPPTIDARLFEETPNGWVDLQLGPGIPAVSLARAIERRRYLVHDYFARIRNASVVVITLGMSEVWWDSVAGVYLNAAPSLASVRRDRDRYSVEIADTQENVEHLERLRNLLRGMNPDMKLVVTVSPVPLGQTFSGRDVAVANMLSKSTLRAAAEQFAIRHNDVDYFPSYDIVALAPRALAYGQDCLHVSDKVVGAIMSMFLRDYAGMDAPGPNFVELAYLAANPDVEEAVRSGALESGFEHWLRQGRAEGRPLKPDSGPTELMIAAGAV